MSSSDAIDLKEWIDTHLIINDKLVAKRCKFSWFEKREFIDIWNKILCTTSFLNNVSFSERLWYTYNNVNNIVTCKNPSCDSNVNFISFPKGHLRTCSFHCAQKDPNTISKIKKTNNKKYGKDYGLANDKIKNKIKNTVKRKYGVSNVSQLDDIKEKKITTSIKNNGIDYVLRDQQKKENAVMKKYGVINVMKNDTVKQKMRDTKYQKYYTYLLNSERFKHKVTPMFSIEEYIGVTDKVYSFKCNTCNTIFDSKMEDGDIPRCNNCYPKSISLFEDEIRNYVSEIISDDIESNNRTILDGKELDIYIPSKSVAIECDGLYWHSELSGGKDKNYHFSKTITCESKNIHLIHIFEDEWILNTDVVKSKLRHLLCHTNNKIYARKCDIRIVDNKTCNAFLNKNHIQGKDNSKIKLGLYYNNEIVSVMTFGNLQVALGNTYKENSYELYRYCTSKHVIGGASKLLNYFVKNYFPHEIITYADRRWTNIHNNLYEKIGFVKVDTTPPNYWYFGKSKKYKRFHRFGFAKHMLKKKLDVVDLSLTEWQNMQLNGYDRIWDCGNIKYIKTF